MQNGLATKYKKQEMLHPVAPGVGGLKILMVNVYMVGEPGNWVLIDAGLIGSADRIRKAAEEHFGPGARPSCILLTHGHFDHIGALKELLRDWNVPVYAHRMEMPYLTGRSDYPPPDPVVGGGGMALLSWLYPRNPIDISAHVLPFPEDGTVPGLPGWSLIHTPGHTPGHVSFFRESDDTLIVGDAFVTTKQESVLSVLVQREEVNGPPAYFTPDWEQAQRSVEKLAALHPRVAATGHGVAMKGEELERQLQELARNFRELAVPKHGRYVDRPAVANEEGVVSVPPPVGPSPKLLIGIGAVALAGAALYSYLNRPKTGDDSNKAAY